jgi:predicted PurR-regulated permease PerM
MPNNTLLQMKKTLASTFVVVVVLSLLYLLTASFTILLLAFGGILFSLFFQSISSKIKEWTGWKRAVTLSLSVVLVLLFYTGISYLIGNQVAQQYDEFAETVPEMIENFKSEIEDTAIGGNVVEKMDDLESGDFELFDNVQKLFKSTFGFFGDIYALLFFGIFLMINPGMYVKGFSYLIPISERENAVRFLNDTGSDLKIWLRATVLEMAFVFTLTAIGLLILGIDLWLILALIAGFLTFIPNIGPALAIIPAFLVGLLSGMETALIVVGLYLLVQVLETGLFGPFIRQKLLSLPPALVLFFQLVMGVFTGGWGILFATPLLVVVMNVVKEYYVKRVADSPTDGGNSFEGSSFGN